MIPGDLGNYDQQYVNHQAPRVRKLVHKWFRVVVEGMEHLPEGPFLAVGNHSGGVLVPDSLAWVSEYHSSGRQTPLMTLINPLMFSHYPRRLAVSLSKLGAVRAEPRIALKALEQGNAVQVYPGGDKDACRSFWRRNKLEFAGHTGYAKLARRAGVPIVPVVSIGGHESLCVLWDGAGLTRLLGIDRGRHPLFALPLSLALPWGLAFGPMPYLPLPVKIRVRVLPPIIAEGDIDEIDAHVRHTMSQTLEEMARKRRLWIG